MPGKHVRFDGVPATPSPTVSSLSLPSSGGPFTPSSGHASPYMNTIPLPHLTVAIHPALIKSPSPALTYDISLPPANIKPANASVPTTIFNEPACQPPQPFLIISHARQNHPIRVNATKKPYVTVSDVLQQIYSQLRIQSGQEEFALLPHESAKVQVSAAYQRRWQRVPDPGLREAERAKGTKRIDFMGTNVRFMGLEASGKGPERWTLHTAPW